MPQRLRWIHQMGGEQANSPPLLYGLFPLFHSSSSSLLPCPQQSSMSSSSANFNSTPTTPITYNNNAATSTNEQSQSRMLSFADTDRQLNAKFVASNRMCAPPLGAQQNLNAQRHPQQTPQQQSMAPGVAFQSAPRTPQMDGLLRPGMRQLKPIPWLDERVDLAQFNRTEPCEWCRDDVVAWVLDVGRRHQIPCEQLNVAKFATCTGQTLMHMNEHRFRELDANYGPLLFREFCTLLTDETFIDNLMANWTSTMSRPQVQQQHPHHQSQSGQMALHNSQMDEAGPSSASGPQPTSNSSNGSSLVMKNITGQPIRAQKQWQKYHPVRAFGTRLESGAKSNEQNFRRCNSRNGRGRKRYKRTKENTLWEFICEALKNPSTCPSIVRWEDPAEGVFRIVESERLAFLWGQKKNNRKMNYEKLSRAMRTYYGKQILVPVPKEGLYPKKLIYKFGPSAHSWRLAALMAVQLKLVVKRDTAASETSLNRVHEHMEEPS